MNIKKYNKKAAIRIIEAIIAILIISAAVLILIGRNIQTVDISEEIYQRQKYILNVVTNNEEMRKEIIEQQQKIIVDNFIRDTIPSSWSFSTCITDIDKVCNIGTPNDNNIEIYVSEAIISSTLETYPDTGSKKLRFFIWRE